MLFVIQAYEMTYGGLHGMFEEAICEETDIEAVREIASEMSRNVIDSYSDIYNSVFDDARNWCDNEDEDSDEFQEALNEAIAEIIAYEIYEIDISKVPSNDETVLANILSSIGFEEFCRQYCFSKEIAS